MPYIFILQTYTYSFENHLCFADRLNLLPEKVCGLPNELFDFGQFLMAYSKEIYPLFLLFLYDFRQLGEKMLNKDFFKLLSFPDIPDKLKNDGASVISELHDRVTAEIKRLKGSYPDIDETAERTKYAALGLCEDNAYLYVRGHNLYDLIVRIGESLCYELKKSENKRLASVDSYDKIKALYADGNSFKKEIKKAALFTDYPEIAKCILDMQTIWPPSL